MQPFTQKYSIVHFLTDLPVETEFSMEQWPLHVALADVFAIDGSSSLLLDSLRENLANTRSFETTVLGEDWFGNGKDVYVMLLEKTQEITHLHTTIMNALRRYNVVCNTPEYFNEGYRPHSTAQKDGRLNLGDTVTINSVSLIDMFPNDNPYQRKVLGTIYLS